MSARIRDGSLVCCRGLCSGKSRSERCNEGSDDVPSAFWIRHPAVRNRVQHDQRERSEAKLVLVATPLLKSLPPLALPSPVRHLHIAKDQESLTSVPAPLGQLGDGIKPIGCISRSARDGTVDGFSGSLDALCHLSSGRSARKHDKPASQPFIRNALATV